MNSRDYSSLKNCIFFQNIILIYKFYRLFFFRLTIIHILNIKIKTYLCFLTASCKALKLYKLNYLFLNINPNVLYFLFLFFLSLHLLIKTLVDNIKSFNLHIKRKYSSFIINIIRIKLVKWRTHFYRKYSIDLKSKNINGYNSLPY